MKRFQSFLSLALIVLITACTSVDQTEHCVKTRFGDVKQEHMATGLNNVVFHDVTCFDMTDQNFPEEGQPTTMQAQTNDPVTVNGDVSVIFAFDPASVYNVFLDKRSEERAKIEILNAIRSGYRNALAGWSVEDIFSARRSALGDSVQSHIQRLLVAEDSAGNSYERAIIRNVFIRNIGIPQRIEEARVEATRQQQILQQARQQLTIDSVNARIGVIQARAAAEEMTVMAVAEADAVEILARAYARNPALMELEAARVNGTAFAEALSNVCTARSTRPDGTFTETVASNCIIGGSVADLAGLPGIN